MRRVLLDTRVLGSAQPTGLGRYAAALFEHLARRHAFEYLVPDGEAGLVPGTCSLPFEIPLGDAPVARRWFEALSRLYDIDLLFSPYLPVPKPPGVRVVLAVHDLIALDHPEWFASDSVNKMFDGPLRESARRADRVLTGSDAVAHDLRTRYGLASTQVTVVPYAAGARFTPGLPADPARVRATAGGSGPFVLSVATLEPRKNLVRLVSAFEQFCSRVRHKGWRLVLVGGLGWNCGDLLAQVDASPLRTAITLVGHVDDQGLVDLYRACHVFAYPTLAEGFGLPLLEALACGCVVLASDLPVLRSVAGGAAHYCDPLDVEAMALALCDAAIDAPLREQLHASSTVQAARFSWDRTAAATESVFRQVLVGD